MKRLCASMALVLAILSFVFVGAAIAQKVTLTAASGGLGGSWYGQMARLSEIIGKADPGIDLKTVPGAGLSNPVRVSNNESQVAWAMPTFAKQAIEGTGEFKSASPNIRGIATGFTLHPLQFIVTKDSGINSIQEIKDKKIPVKIAIGRAGSVDEVAARLIIEYYGMTYAMIRSWGGEVLLLEYGEQVKKMQDRQVNAYIVIMPIPAATVQEMMLARELKMLPLDPKMAEVFREKYAFASQKIPKDCYEGKMLDQDIIVPSINLSLIVNKDVDPAIVYRITKAINENAEQVRGIGPTFVDFNPANAWDNIGAPLHLGAEKYYKEKGLMK
jgi:TRAP transporter TAXI family solute receptor